MAQERQSLEESSIDSALQDAAAARVFNGGQVATRDDADDDDDEADLIGGHPAQEETVEDDGEVGSTTPELVATPTSSPVTVAADDTRYRDAERRMNLAIEEAAALKAERDRLTREAEELRRQIAPPAATTPQDVPDSKAAWSQMSQRLRDIATVDEKQPDYWDRLGDGWRDALDPIMEARATAIFQNLSPSQQSAMRTALLKDPEFLDGLKTALVPGVQSQVANDQEQTRVFRYVVDQAKEAGFDVDGQGDDPELFWNVAIAHTDRALPQGTTEEKTARALEIMRSLKGLPPSEPTAPEPPAPPRPSRPVRQPMGRQSAGPVVPAGGTETPPEQPFSIEDALKITHGRNRV